MAEFSFPPRPFGNTLDLETLARERKDQLQDDLDPFYLAPVGHTKPEYDVPLDMRIKLGEVGQSLYYDEDFSTRVEGTRVVQDAVNLGTAIGSYLVRPESFTISASGLSASKHQVDQYVYEDPWAFLHLRPTLDEIVCRYAPAVSGHEGRQQVHYMVAELMTSLVLLQIERSRIESFIRTEAEVAGLELAFLSDTTDES